MGQTAFLMPDISHWQGAHSRSDFETAAKTVKAIMFKSTEGTGYVDSEFNGNVASAQAAGLPWGAYHFVNQGNGAIQAHQFWNTANRPGLRFVCIDWEEGDRQTVTDMASELRKIAKVPVGIYSGSWSRGHGGPPPGMDWAMVPHYGPAQLEKAYYPNPYPLAAWQYTDGPINGTTMPSSIPGIGPCDVSIVYRPADMGLAEGADMTDAQLAQLKAATAALAGVQDFLDDRPPADTAATERKQMYRALARASSQPVPTPGGGTAHTHAATTIVGTTA